MCPSTIQKTNKQKIRRLIFASARARIPYIQFCNWIVRRTFHCKSSSWIEIFFFYVKCKFCLNLTAKYSGNENKMMHFLVFVVCACCSKRDRNNSICSISLYQIIVGSLYMWVNKMTWMKNSPCRCHILFVIFCFVGYLIVWRQHTIDLPKLGIDTYSATLKRKEIFKQQANNI